MSSKKKKFSLDQEFGFHLNATSPYNYFLTIYALLQRIEYYYGKLLERASENQREQIMADRDIAFSKMSIHNDMILKNFPYKGDAFAKAEALKADLVNSKFFMVDVDGVIRRSPTTRYSNTNEETSHAEQQ